MELGSSPVPISDPVSDSGKLFTEYGCRELRVKIDRLDCSKLQSLGRQGWFKLDDSFVSTGRTPRRRRPKEYIDFEMSPVTSRLKNKENGMVLLHRATYNKNPGKCVLPKSHSITSSSNKKISPKEKSTTKCNAAIPIKVKNNIEDNIDVIENDDEESVSDSCGKSDDKDCVLLDTPDVSNEKSVLEENGTKDEEEKVDIVLKTVNQEETCLLEDDADKTDSKCPIIQTLEVVGKRRKSLPDQLRKAVTESVESGLDVKCKKLLRAKSMSLSGDIKVVDKALIRKIEDTKETDLKSFKMSVSSEESPSLDKPQNIYGVSVTEKKSVQERTSKKRKLTSNENPQMKNDTESNISDDTLKLQEKAKHTIDKKNVVSNKLQKAKGPKDSTRKKRARSDTMLEENNQRRKLRNNKDFTAREKKHRKTRSLQVDKRNVLVGKVQSKKRMKAQHTDKLRKHGGNSNKIFRKNVQNVRVLRRKTENVHEEKLVKESTKSSIKLDERIRKIATVKSGLTRSQKLRQGETNKFEVGVLKLKKSSSSIVQKIENSSRLKTENLMKNRREKQNILKSKTERSAKTTNVVEKKDTLKRKAMITTKNNIQNIRKKLKFNAENPLKRVKNSYCSKTEAIKGQLKSFDDVEAALAKIVNGTNEYSYKNLEELYMKIDTTRFPSNLWKTEVKLLNIVNGELKKTPKREKKVENLKTSSLSEVVIKRCIDLDSGSHDRLVVVNKNLNFQIKIENDTVSLLGAPSVIPDIEDLYVLLQIVDETTLNSFNIDK